MVSPVQFSGRYKIQIEFAEDVKARPPAHMLDRLKEEVFHLTQRDITHKGLSDERRSMLTTAPDGKIYDDRKVEDLVILTNDGNGDHVTQYEAADRQVYREHAPVPTPQDFLKSPNPAADRTLMDRWNAFSTSLLGMIKRFTEDATVVKVKVTDASYDAFNDRLHTPKFEYVDFPGGFEPQFGTVPNKDANND